MLFFTLEHSWITVDKPWAHKLSHLAMLGRMSVGSKAQRLVPLSSCESRHLTAKLLLTVETGMHVVWQETQLVDIYRKESDNLKASLNWLRSCLRWFSKLSLWVSQWKQLNKCYKPWEYFNCHVKCLIMFCPF